MLTRNIIVDTWKSLVNWYMERSRYWDRLLKLIEEGDFEGERSLLNRAYGLWGYVWHENDLVMLFSHKLLKYIEEKSLDIHLHVNYKLKPSNFRLINDFYVKLSKAVKELRKALGSGRNRFPEIDLIITGSEPPFLYCLEFKYYHYFPITWNVVEDLRRKVSTLKTLRNYGVCMDAGILLLDDGVCRRNKKLCKEIERVLSDAHDYLLTLAYYVTYDDLVSIFKSLRKE